VQLVQGQKLRPLMVVIADVVQRLGDAVHCRRLLGLDRQDRDAIDEEHDVQPDVWGRAVAERELLVDVEQVCFWVFGVKQAHVAFALLSFDEHGLETLEKFPGVQVASDIRADADKALDDFPWYRISAREAGPERLVN